MDPDEALKQQREAANTVVDSFNNDDLATVSEAKENECYQLAESSKALDEWLMKGGFLPKDWARKCNGGFVARATLAVKVYDKLYEHTQTFEGGLGEQLSYLFPAILKGEFIELREWEDHEVLQVLHLVFPKEHEVWQYIQLEGE